MLVRGAVVLCTGLLLFGLPLQGESLAATVETEPGTGVDNGVDPLYFRHRVELGLLAFDAEGRRPDSGYTAVVRADWAVTATGKFQLTLPYSALQFGGGESTNDFGDMVLQFLRKVDRRAPDTFVESVGFGVGLIIPSGDLADHTGRAQWAVVPVLLFSAYPGHGVGIFSSFRFTKSLVNDERGSKDIAELSVSSMFSWSHPRWWIAAEPEAVVDFAMGGTTSYALRFQAGVQLSRKFAVLAGVGTTLGGSRELFDEEARIGLRFLP